MFLFSEQYHTGHFTILLYRTNGSDWMPIIVLCVEKECHIFLFGVNKKSLCLQAFYLYYTRKAAKARDLRSGFIRY